MKNSILLLILTAISLYAWISCYPYGAYFDVMIDPPPLRVEIRSDPPGPDYIWINGYWDWNGHTYIWISGHWSRHNPHKEWQPGHWEQRPHGWVWMPGRWVHRR